VHLAFPALHVITLLKDVVDVVLAFREHVRFEVGQGRRGLAWTHVRPDDPAALYAGIGYGADLALEVAFGGLGGHVDAGAGDVELPAVVDAAQALFFVPTEEERRSSVRAGVLDKAELPRRRPKGDEVFTEQADSQRRAVGRGQLIGADG